MEPVRVQIDAALQANLLELCALRGVTYISVVVSEHSVYFGASVPEYIKVLKTTATTTCEDFALRIPMKILKPVISVGALTFELGDYLVITKHVFSTVAARIQVPIEMDFLSGFICQIIKEGDSLTDASIDLRVLGQLRELSFINKNGVQVKDGLAFIDSSGFIVYKNVPGIKQPFLLSHDCLSMLIQFVSHSEAVQLFKLDNFDIIRRENMYFGWRRARAYVPTSYEDYMGLVPLFSKSVSFASAREIIKSITIDKTKEYKCLLNFEKDYIQINAGNIGTFAVKFSGQFTQENEDPEILSVTIPFAIFKEIISITALNWESFQFTVYESCVSLQFGETIILIVRG
ncbi:MAG: hypothetical protein RSC43_00050 [Clostridia bacterium]